MAQKSMIEGAVLRITDFVALGFFADVACVEFTNSAPERFDG